MSLRTSPKHGLNPSVGLCFVCGEPKSVLLLGLLPGDEEAPRQAMYDYAPCEKCEDLMQLGVVCISVDPARSKAKLRKHTCLSCNHSWVADVRYGNTPNMSGELSEQCRRCNRKTAISSGPQYDGLSTNPYRTGGWAVLKDDAVRKFITEPKTLEHVLRVRMLFMEDAAWDKLGLPRGPFAQEGEN